MIQPHAFFFFFLNDVLAKVLKHLWMWTDLPGWEAKEWKRPKSSSQASTRETYATALWHGEREAPQTPGFGVQAWDTRNEQKKEGGKATPLEPKSHPVSWPAQLLRWGMWSV